MKREISWKIDLVKLIIVGRIEEIGYIINGLVEMKEKDTSVEITQHSPMTVKSNIQFND